MPHPRPADGGDALLHRLSGGDDRLSRLCRTDADGAVPLQPDAGPAPPEEVDQVQDLRLPGRPGEHRFPPGGGGGDDGVLRRPLGTIKTMPYPGFPTDMQSVMMAAAATARGSTVFVENIFESRYGCR